MSDSRDVRKKKKQLNAMRSAGEISGTAFVLALFMAKYPDWYLDTDLFCAVRDLLPANGNDATVAEETRLIIPIPH